MLVRDIMTPNPITIRPESDYLAAIAIMRAGGFRRLPVVDSEGRLVGIVTYNDLLKVRAQQADEAARQAAVLGDGVLIRVREVMTSPVVSIPAEYPLEEAARVMIEHHITSLPVIEEGRVVGIITATDIFKTLVAMLGGGSGAVRLSVQVDNTPGQLAALAGRVASVGGNILSIASHPAERPERLNFTLRVEGAAPEALLAAIRAHPGAEVRYVWDQGVGE